MARHTHRPELRTESVREHVLVAPLSVLQAHVRSLLSADAAIAVHMPLRTSGVPSRVLAEAQQQAEGSAELQCHWRRS